MVTMVPADAARTTLSAWAPASLVVSEGERGVLAGVAPLRPPTGKRAGVPQGRQYWST